MRSKLIKSLILWAFTILAVPSFVSAETLRVLTYNTGLLKVFGNNIVKLVDARSDRIPEVLASLAEKEKIDIIALQEVWDNQHAEKIKSALSIKGFQFFRKDDKVKLYGNGLLFAVRNVDLLDSEFIEFKVKAGLEGATEKGFSSLKLQTPSGLVFRILNTHLQALTTKDGLPTVEREKEASQAQSHQLTAYLNDPARRDEASIIAGDLNIGPNYIESFLEHFNKTGFINTYLSLHPTNFEPTWDRENLLVKTGAFSEEHSSAIDHILVRESQNTRIKPLFSHVLLKETHSNITLDGKPSPLSDHYGLIAEIEISPRE